MPKNPLAAQISKEEKLYSAEIAKRVTKALQAAALQKKLDAATNSSTPKPPKPIAALYAKALAAEQKAISKSYAGLNVVITPSYSMKGAQWIGTATAAVKYPLITKGGGKHKVRPGDTLWDLAQSYYGSGYYWAEIEAANPAQVYCNGDFILAGTTLTIPKLDIVDHKATQPVAIKKTTSAPKPAARKARPVATPIVEIDLEKSSAVQTVAKAPGMTFIFTMTLKGTLKAQKPGTLPVSFNLRSYEAEIADGAKPFQSSFKIKRGEINAISVASNVSGSTWTSKLSWSATGAVTCSMAPKPVKFKNKGIVYTGNVGIQLEIRAIPDPKVKVPRSVPVTERIGDWFHDHKRTLAGVGLLTAAGTLVVVTVGEDIVTLGAGIADDPVSFAAAGMMAQRALVMIK